MATELDKPEFQIAVEVDDVATEVVKGLSLRCISLPAGPAHGRALIFDIRDFQPKEQGQTVGNEINYDPYCESTSFTAFGVQHQTKKLIVVSMFAGELSESDNDTFYFGAEQGQGITLNEMAELMRTLGASDAIAGGGAGDTQQYVYKRGVWAGQPRHQPDRPQVEGLRGLGAIFALLA